MKEKIRKNPLGFLLAVCAAAFLGLYGYVFAARTFEMPTFEHLAGDPAVLDGLTVTFYEGDERERKYYTIKDGKLSRRTDWGEHRDWDNMQHDQEQDDTYDAYYEWLYGLSDDVIDYLGGWGDWSSVEEEPIPDGGYYVVLASHQSYGEEDQEPRKYLVYRVTDQSMQTLHPLYTLETDESIDFDLEVLPDGGLLMTKNVSDVYTELRWYSPAEELLDVQRIEKDVSLWDKAEADVPYRLYRGREWGEEGTTAENVTVCKLTDTGIEVVHSWRFAAPRYEMSAWQYMDGWLCRFYRDEAETCLLEVYDTADTLLYRGAVRGFDGWQDLMVDHFVRKEEDPQKTYQRLSDQYSFDAMYGKVHRGIGYFMVAEQEGAR